MENSKKIIIIVLIILVLTMFGKGKLDITGESINNRCRMQRFFGDSCDELGPGWEEDTINPGYCRKCTYENYKHPGVLS